jgi:oligopeptidase B
MNIKYLVGIFSLLAIGCKEQNNMTKTPYQWPTVAAPIAEQKEHIRILHGDTVPDPYYWMIDYFKKGPDSTEVVNYLKAENAYTDQMMAGTNAFQSKLFNEMKARIKEKDESVPVFRNGYFYYTRVEVGKQYYKYCRKKGSLTAKEEILLDVDQMAEGKPYYNVTGMSVSPNNQFLVFGIDEVSRRQYTLHIKNLETGAILTDSIKGTNGYGVWANDNQTIFYTLNNPVTLLSEKILRHQMNSTVPDVLVYEEKDKSNYIGVGRSKNGQYIFIASQATLSSEVWYIKADQPTASFTSFQPRQPNVLYDVEALNDRFVIRTNANALNFKVMECPLDKTNSMYWKELIPHRADVLVQSVEAFNQFIVVTERKNGLIQLRIKQHNTDEAHYINFGEPAYTAGLGANPEFNTNTIRYVYTSLTTPNSVYDYDVKSKSKTLKKQQEVVGGYNPKDYTTERIYATANDGTKIPISLVYKNGFKKDGNAPLLLYAYGSYGYSLDADFSSTILSLLNRGFVYALAHIRGGEDLGRQWYEDGKLLKKKNSFTDFINCGEYLVKQQYTSSQHLYANGGSAGGLLMGAVVNMAPDLWHGVIAEVPFVDVVNTMLDESIPLTTNEFDEWGNPKEKAYYEYQKSYSPYENVAKKAYPHLLVTTGLHDSQVQYFEPAKWVARLRTMKTDKNVLLFKTNMDYGHGGASGRFDYLKETALNYAFLLALEGILD